MRPARALRLFRRKECGDSFPFSDAYLAALHAPGFRRSSRGPTGHQQGHGMSFKDTGLSEKVLAAVEAAGYSEPTPIQAQAIPHALSGRDVLGIAQTGTGKTAAFTLPMLSRLESGRARARMPRTLILEPTRELAAQVEESFVKYGANHKLNVALLIGGVSFGDQEAKIMRGADVLIATPGRLIDFHERGKLLLTGIEILVIDEADRMLDMGFIPDIEKICKLVPFTRQTLFFSATMPPEITRLTEQFLQNPVRVEVARVGTTASTITQGFVASHSGSNKRETLRRMIREADGLRNAIIFANRKRDVAILHKSLTTHGFSAGALHGDMDQPARMASLDAFKRGDVALLVCSDVAARGLDIPDVSHVFNFDVPIHPDDYVHRIGRTGRAGKSGVAITIVTAEDAKHVAAIEKLIKLDVNWLGPEPDALGEAPPDRDRLRARREGGRDGRSGRRDRDRSSESRSRRERFAENDKTHGSHRAPEDQAAMTPFVADPTLLPPPGAVSDQERPARGPRRPRPERGERTERAPRPVAAAARPERAERPPRPEREERGPRPERGAERRGRRHDDDDGPPVRGMGDHTPSFLLRPVKMPAPRPRPQAQTAAAED
jgi:superfamily II DNA/RNA helicase